MSDHGYQAFAADTDTDAVARLLELAFGGTDREATVKWMESGGHDLLRVYREKGRAVGCALLNPMGQFFGGRRIGMTGVAGVAVAPEARGRGIGGEVMEGLIKEMAESRTPISTLYPATQTLYRRSGYEQAGSRFVHYVDLRRLGMRESGSRLREATEADQPAVKDLAERFGAAHNGFLSRGDYIWGRVFGGRSKERLLPGLVAPSTTGDGLDGAVYFQQVQNDENPRIVGHRVHVSDLIATEIHAARSLLSALAGLSTVAGEARIFGGPNHPLLYLLPQQVYRVELVDQWMTRVLDVQKAVEARGYPAGFSGEAHVTLVDELLLGNAGKWVITVEGGRATCKRGGRGDVKMHVRQLASVYTGYMSPVQLAQIGLVDGPEDVVERLSAMFAGAAPWMSDSF